MTQSGVDIVQFVCMIAQGITLVIIAIGCYTLHNRLKKCEKLLNIKIEKV